MLIPNTTCFFTLGANNEAAQTFAHLISRRAANDIENVSLVGQDFTSDIECLAALTDVINEIEMNMQTELQLETVFNPIYFPTSCSPDDQDFTLGDFVWSHTESKLDGLDIKGDVCYHPFNEADEVDIRNLS